jgi:hypothetical protein
MRVSLLYQAETSSSARVRDSGITYRLVQQVSVGCQAPPGYLMLATARLGALAAFLLVPHFGAGLGQTAHIL